MWPSVAADGRKPEHLGSRQYVDDRGPLPGRGVGIAELGVQFGGWLYHGHERAPYVLTLAPACWDDDRPRNSSERRLPVPGWPCSPLSRTERRGGQPSTGAQNRRYVSSGKSTDVPICAP